MNEWIIGILIKSGHLCVLRLFVKSPELLEGRGLSDFSLISPEIKTITDP